MWIFIFVLAMIPLAYNWSDQVVTLFPSLAQYLPQKTTAETQRLQASGLDGKPVPGKDGLWVQTHTDQGFAAWLISADDQYRLAVGCRSGQPAAMQVTKAYTASPDIPKNLTLNFQYGQAPMRQSIYEGRNLVGDVAQFAQVSLEVPSAKNQGAAPFATFNALSVESGKVARVIQQKCARS